MDFAVTFIVTKSPKKFKILIFLIKNDRLEISIYAYPKFME